MTIQNISYGAVQTAYVSYTSYDLNTNNTNLVLFWPTPYATSTNILAATTNLNCTATGCSINFPNANEVSLGMNIFIRNSGSQNVTVNDFNGSEIVVVEPGIVFWIQLTAYTMDNAGTWISIQQGAGTSGAVASELAGYGLQALANKLNTVTFTKAISLNYTVVGTDQSTLLIATSSFTIDLSTFPAGFYFSVNNAGNGTVGFSGATINNQPNFTLGSGQTATFVSDGTNWWTLGLGEQIGFADTIVTINLEELGVTGGGSVDLTELVLDNFVHQIYSSIPITGDVTLYYRDTSSNWYISNFCSSSNGSKIFISAGITSSPSGTPTVVPMGEKLIFYLGPSPSTGILSMYYIPTVLTSGTVLLDDGTVANPSLAFVSDQTSGMYLPSTYNPTIAAHGTAIAQFSATTATTPQILVNAGTGDYPNYCFQGSPTYGMGTQGSTLDFFAGNAAAVSQIMGSGTDTSLSLIAKPSNATATLTSSTGGALLAHTTPTFSSSLNLLASSANTASLSVSTSGLPAVAIGCSTTGAFFTSTTSTASAYAFLNGTATSSFFSVLSSQIGGNSALLLTANDGGLGTITNNSILSVSISATGVVSFPQRAPTLNAVMPPSPEINAVLYFDGTNWVASAGSITPTQVLTINGSGVPAWA